MRRLLTGLAAAAVIAAVLLMVLPENRKAIARARAEAAQLTSERDSLLGVVRENERQQAELLRERDTHETVIAGLLDSVQALERERAASQLTVRQIRTTGALLERLRQAFPELGDSAWGLTVIPLEPDDSIGLEYLMLPAWFAETFVIDHANAESWRAQKDGLRSVDSLRLLVSALQDSVTRLEEAKTGAYEAGYRAAYAGYHDLSQRYVTELRKPKLRLGSALSLILAAGAGMLVAEVIDE